MAVLRCAELFRLVLPYDIEVKDRDLVADRVYAGMLLLLPRSVIAVLAHLGKLLISTARL